MTRYNLKWTTALFIIGALLVTPLLGWAQKATPTDAPPAKIDTNDTYIKEALLNGKLVQRWNDSTKVIEVALISGKSIPDWTPKAATIVRDAFEEWQSALNGKIKFNFSNNPAKTDVVVKWASNSNGQQIGHQNLRWNGDIVTDASLTISLRNSRGQLFTDEQLRAVALHEIGHMLGIRGHSANPKDIMYKQMQAGQSRLSPRDIATIQTLYKRKADVTNPPGIHLLQYREFEHHMSLGYAATKRQNYEEAYQDFSKAQQAFPKDPKIDYLVGITAFNIKKYDDAIKHLKQFSAKPSDEQANAMYYLATALRITGAKDIQAQKNQSGFAKLSQAQKYYDTVSKNPKSPADIRKSATDYRDKIGALMAHKRD
jgi:tetratricopeptide (TPR) repeat protein